MGRWWLMTTARTPTAGASAIITPTSPHGKQSRLSFRINGEEGNLSPKTYRRPKEQGKWFNTSLFIPLGRNRSNR
jgi:hypothetical protein